MNTEPQDPQRLKALELALQARRETLSDTDQAFLDGALEADSSLRAEISEMTAFLGDLEPARIAVRPEFEQRLQTTVSGWVREAALSASATMSPAASRNPLVNGWRWLFGRDSGQRDVSWSTLFLGRSLAVYAGAAAVVCVFLLMRDPAPTTEVRPLDRATEPNELEEAPKADTRRGDREGLGTKKGR